jgi:hypothetical protein
VVGSSNHSLKPPLGSAGRTGNPGGHEGDGAYPDLIVKDSYWRCPERDVAGNAIDFFMRVLGLAFHDAMRQITGR